MEDSLTFPETVRTYPRSFLAPALVAILVLVAVFTGLTGWIIAASCVGCLVFCCAPLIFEGFMPGRDQRNKTHTKRRRMIESRPLRKGKSILAVPDGEYVTIHTWAQSTYGVYHTDRRFHAEEEAEAAQDYAAEMRTRTPSETGPSDDALTLARALNS